MLQLDLFSENISPKKNTVSYGAKRFLALCIINSCSISIHRKINIRFNNTNYMVGDPYYYTGNDIFESGNLYNKNYKEVVRDLFYRKNLVKNSFMPHGIPYYQLSIGNFSLPKNFKL